MALSERARLTHVYSIQYIHLDGAWTGPVLTRERAPRASRHIRDTPYAEHRVLDNARDPCHTSFLPSSFTSRVLGAPLRRISPAIFLRIAFNILFTEILLISHRLNNYIPICFFFPSFTLLYY